MNCGRTWARWRCWSRRQSMLILHTGRSCCGTIMNNNKRISPGRWWWVCCNYVEHCLRLGGISWFDGYEVFNYLIIMKYLNTFYIGVGENLAALNRNAKIQNFHLTLPLLISELLFNFVCISKDANLNVLGYYYVFITLLKKSSHDIHNTGHWAKARG